MMSNEEVIGKVIKHTDSALLDNAAVYMLASPFPAGASLEINGHCVTPGSDAHVIFIDLRPGANWAHPCRYLLIDDQVRSFDSSFPPDINNYRLLLKGDKVEDWMLLTSERS